MKYASLIISTLVILIAIDGSCQIKNAKIKYTETLHFELPEHVKAMGREIPTSRESKKILFINSNESMYTTNKEDIEEEAKDRIDGRRRRGSRFRMGSDSDMYINKEEGIVLDQINMFDKDFLVKEELKQYKWKIIATEQREILGHTCMKAEYQDTSNLVTAWFAPQIPLSYGPADFTGLPGLILAVSDGEDRIILATTVETNISEVSIDKPASKKTYTRDEFNTLRDEKIEEMRAMWGGGRRGR